MPPGCSSGLLLWDADLPPVQLERSRWSIGVCISGGHTGFSGLHWWEPDPGHPQSPPSVADTTPTQVRAGFGTRVLATCVFGRETCLFPRKPSYAGSRLRGFETCSCWTAALTRACVFQGDQPRPWIEAGRGDPHHLSEAHREHRPHLLRVLYRLWHLGSAGAFSDEVMFALNKSLHTRRDALLQFKDSL